MIKETKTAVTDFITIDLNTLRIDSLLGFYLYVKINQEYVLFRAPRLPFTNKTRKTLIQNGVQHLYISQDDSTLYQSYIESNLQHIVNDNSIDDASKSAIIYTSAKLLVKELLEKPTLPENMQRGLAMVESTALHLLKSKDAFHTMLKVMSYDYSVYTHSVNVCTFSLALANQIGITDKKKLHHLGTGALLHDIGKCRVSSAILDKKGSLTNAEMAIIKRHPLYGMEIILKSEFISPEAHFPILQHHERENGSGYPHNLHSKEIHLFGKIVAIADVFDAMTTNRVYRDAIDAYSALQEIYRDANCFSSKLLREFTLLMGPNNISPN